MESITWALPRAKTKTVPLTWQKSAYTHEDHHAFVVQSQSCVHVDGQYNQGIAQGKNKGCVPYLTKGCLCTRGPSCICNTVPGHCACRRAENQGKRLCPLPDKKAAYTHEDHHAFVVQSQSCLHVDGQYNQGIAQGKNKGCAPYLTKGCLYKWGICSTVPELHTCRRAV